MAQTVSALYRTRRCSLEATTSIRGYVWSAGAYFRWCCCWDEHADQNDLLQNIFERHPGDSLTPLARLTCGGIAGVTSVTFTYPLDIVRTRLSIQSASFAELGDRPKKLPGMWQTMAAMYKNEGGILAL